MRYAKEVRNDRPFNEENFYSRDALFAIFQNARKICGDAPLAANILYAQNDYGRVVKDACEAGVDIVITGAGLPVDMPKYTQDFPDVALVPIVSSARALKLIIKKWKRYDKLPDAVIVEGPLSGGHQGFSYEDCFKEEFQLENLIPQVIEEAKNWGDIPVIAAGGIWDKNDIDTFLNLGCAGVQMATRFIATHECDAAAEFKEVLKAANKDDIELLKSPVGLPARGVRTNLINLVDKKEGPKIACISNCVAPCKKGEEAKAVGYCIADRLGDAYMGNKEFGLFFTGSNGYKIDSIISVRELMDKLVNGEDS
jgi:nitronate monooxygenase